MANYHFARAGNWEHLVAEHDRWPAAIRKGTGRTKEETATGARRRSSVRWSSCAPPEDLERAFFSTRFVRRLDVLGYACLKHWRGLR